MIFTILANSFPLLRSLSLGRGNSGRQVPSTPPARKLSSTQGLMTFHNYPQLSGMLNLSFSTLSQRKLHNETYAHYH